MTTIYTHINSFLFAMRCWLFRLAEYWSGVVFSHGFGIRASGSRHMCGNGALDVEEHPFPKKQIK